MHANVDTSKIQHYALIWRKKVSQIVYWKSYALWQIYKSMYQFIKWSWVVAFLSFFNKEACQTCSIWI